MARIVVIAPDLMLGSRIEETLRTAGHDVTLVRSTSAAPLDDADLLIADLEDVSAEAMVGHGVPVIGFHPHTNVELKQAAEAAGVDLVVPRSRMAREMQQLVHGLLTP